MLAFLCGLFFVVAALAAGFAAFALSLERVEAPLSVEAEGVVALTGESERVVEASEILARGQARRLLITGVNRSTRGRELAKFLPVSRKLFACCVDLGYEALDTIGNAQETKDWAKRRGITESLIVVTANYHMPRALLELSAVLPGVALHPFPVVTERVQVADWPRDLNVARLVAVEYGKYLLALARIKLLGAAVSGEAPPAPDSSAPRQRGG